MKRSFIITLSLAILLILPLIGYRAVHGDPYQFSAYHPLRGVDNTYVVIRLPDLKPVNPESSDRDFYRVMIYHQGFSMTDFFESLLFGTRHTILVPVSMYNIREFPNYSFLLSGGQEYIMPIPTGRMWLGVFIYWPRSSGKKRIQKNFPLKLQPNQTIRLLIDPDKPEEVRYTIEPSRKGTGPCDYDRTKTTRCPGAGGGA